MNTTDERIMESTLIEWSPPDVFDPPPYVITQEGSSTILHLKDDERVIDTQTANKIFGAVVQTVTGGSLIIDMEGTIAPTSSFITLIIRLHKRMKKSGIDMTLINVEPNFYARLTTLRLTTLLTIQ